VANKVIVMSTTNYLRTKLKNFLNLFISYDKVDNSANILIFGNSLGLIFSLLTVFLILNNLDVRDYELFVLSLAFTYTISMPSNWGMPIVVMREVAKSPQLAREWWISAIKLHLILWLLCFSFSIFIITYYNWYGIDLHSCIILMVMWISDFIGSSTSSTLRSLDKPELESLLTTLKRILQFSCILICINLFPVNILTISISFALGPIISLICGIVLLLRISDQPNEKISLKTPFRLGMPFAPIIFLIPLVPNLDRFILGSFGILGALTMYDLSQRLSTAGSAFNSALQSSLMPSMSILKKNTNDLFTLINNRNGFILKWSSLGLLLAPLTAPKIIDYILNGDFPATISIFNMLLLAWCLSFLAIPYITSIESLTTGKSLKWIFIISIFMDGLITFFTVDYLGAFAAGIGTVAMQMTFIVMAAAFCIYEDLISRIPKMHILLFLLYSLISLIVMLEFIFLDTSYSTFLISVVGLILLIFWSKNYGLQINDIPNHFEVI